MVEGSAQLTVVAKCLGEGEGGLADQFPLEYL